MTLPVNHPLNEIQLDSFTSSLGSTPLVAYIRVPYRGTVLKVGVIQNGAVTGTSTVATAINGTAITGGSLSVTSGSAGTLFSQAPTAANKVKEDDVISFTPSGATGTVTGHCFVVIRKEA